MQQFFDEIISIEEIGEVDTIDIETDGNHLFFANNILTHNSAVGATAHDHAQIAGGISKINVADVYWSIIFTEQMRAMNKIIFILQKTRNSDGLGKQIHLKWEPKYLRIVNEDHTSKSNPLEINLKPNSKDKSTDLLCDEEQSPTPSGNKLMDMLTNYTL